MRARASGQGRQSSGGLRLVQQVERATVLDLGIWPLEPAHHTGAGEDVTEMIDHRGDHPQAAGILPLGPTLSLSESQRWKVLVLTPTSSASRAWDTSSARSSQRATSLAGRSS